MHVVGFLPAKGRSMKFVVLPEKPSSKSWLVVVDPKILLWIINSGTPLDHKKCKFPYATIFERQENGKISITSIACESEFKWKLRLGYGKSSFAGHCVSYRHSFSNFLSLTHVWIPPVHQYCFISCKLVVLKIDCKRIKISNSLQWNYEMRRKELIRAKYKLWQRRSGMMSGNRNLKIKRNLFPEVHVVGRYYDARFTYHEVKTLQKSFSLCFYGNQFKSKQMWSLA